MTKDEALRMALEALDGGAFGKELERVVLALRAALEEQPAEQQEPVAWRYNGKLHEFDPSDWATGPVTPLYTSPPAKPWVGLTEDQKKDSMDTMDFGDALAALKAGSKVARNGWNGKGMWLELQVPDEYSHMTLPYVYLNYPEDAQNTPGARVPWLASQTDMLAEDWRLFD